MTDPVALAAQIAEHGEKIANQAYSTIALICKGDPQFEDILLLAVEIRLMELHQAVQRKMVER